MFSLPRIYKSPMGLRHGLLGRSMLGYRALRALGSAPGGSDSLKGRFTPAVVDGDIYITSIWTSDLYSLQMRQDGTYWYDANGDTSRQLILADRWSITFGTLAGEGVLSINNRPPRVNTPSGSFFGNGIVQIGQPLSLQLAAIDPDDSTTAIGFTVQSGVFIPGCTLSGTGLVTGTPSTFGTVGFVIRIKDPYGAFTDSVEQVTTEAFLPNFVGQQYSTAQATIAGLGLTSSQNPITSARPTGEILDQSVPPQTPITGSFNVSFNVSNGVLFVSNPNLFPTNILGIKLESTRTPEWNTGYQRTMTAKVSSLAYMQYPIIHWDLNYELIDRTRPLDELIQIESLFKTKQGSGDTFLYLDPAFNAVAAERFGTGDGAKRAFQLIATYAVAGGPGAPEAIQQLQTAPALFDNGVPISTSAYTVGATGIITFTSAPAAGHALTWTGSFFYLAMFETDDLSPDAFLSNFWELQSLKLKSVIV
jgi:uncharacterized protein (TIGR02217 family)